MIVPRARAVVRRPEQANLTIVIRRAADAAAPAPHPGVAPMPRSRFESDVESETLSRSARRRRDFLRFASAAAAAAPILTEAHLALAAQKDDPVLTGATTCSARRPSCGRCSPPRTG
jgi:hypothetical protein